MSNTNDDKTMNTSVDLQTQIKQNVRLRGTFKGIITRIRKFVETFPSENGDFNLLQIKYDNLINTWHKYDEVQVFLEVNAEDEDSDRVEIEETVDNLRSICQRLLTVKEVGDDSNSSSKSSKNKSSIVLPQINLPHFDGSYSEWLSFSEFFKVLVHDNPNLTTVQKFHYLISALSGQAKQLVKNLSLTSDNYIVAWNLLENRYANKRLIASNHAQEIINVFSVTKESPSGLAKFIDKISSNINALRALDVNYAEVILIQMLSQRVDPNTIKAWEMKMDADQFPSINDFIHFLEKRRQMLENASCTSMYSQVPKYDKSSTTKCTSSSSKLHSHVHHAQTTTNKNECPCCKQTHALHKCFKFCNMTINDRVSFVKQNKLCLNCFNSNHFAKECTNIHKCKHCKGNHHSLLHFERSSNRGSSPEEETTPTSGSYCGLKSQSVSKILLATAVLSIKDRFDQSHICRALLDAGSQVNFISESLAQRLRLNRQSTELNISGINSTSAYAKYSVTVNVSSHYNDFSTDVTCFVLPRITGQIPSSTVDISGWQLPTDIQLADKDFNLPGRIDLLIGAEIFLYLLMQGRIEQGNHFPVLQETKLGWIVSGRLPSNICRHIEERSSHVTTLLATSAVNIQRQLQRFWEIEEIAEGSLRSKEDDYCENHFRKNTYRDDSGRFVVKLPRREGHTPLGKSHANAETRFYSLERRLNKDEKLKEEYTKFMKAYIGLGHMQRIEDIHSSELKSNEQPYYLPHHAVLKESSTTTKTRVVFDASAKASNDVSLNDTLMVGPTVQQDIISIILRFRTHTYAMTADITKMYRQVRIHPKDYDLQRILWRDDPQQELGHYQLTTVTYGTGPAAFLATRCLVQLAQERKQDFPHASEIIMRDFYVDDLQTGGDDLEKTKKLQQNIIEILETGGFSLHKWCANDRRLIESIPEHKREIESSIKFDDSTTINTLGLVWDHTRDILNFDINVKHIKNDYTKRTVLSTIASIYDPLGLLGPFLVSCKVFMQRLWQQDLKWDEKLSVKLESMWVELHKQMPLLKDLAIPRLVKATGKIIDFQIHGFSDASENAYGACLYLRTVNTDGYISVHLLCSKSRVAPIKQISVPRLELCGALLLSRLAKRVLPILCLKIKNIYLWTDSTVVLAWLSATPTRWKTFVANRVSEIQEITDKYQWRHVNSKDNPADILSRGASPQKLQEHRIWWNGPSWLQQREEEWPQHTQGELSDKELEIRRQASVLNVIQSKSDITIRFSSLRRMLRVITYVLRFIQNVRHPSSKLTTTIAVKELKETLHRCIKQVQGIYFRDEMSNLEHDVPISIRSKILALHPFIDKLGCLRVGGRLQQSDMEFENKHPLILPSKAHLTRLIIENEHERLLHAGPQLVHSSLRQLYWIVNGRGVIRQVLHRCFKCFRLNAVESKQLMGQLPKNRVRIARPFVNVGVDYAGPFTIRQGGRRSKITTKSYVALFICFSTKAIHIELVSDLSSEAFIAALRRFVSRRGACSNVYSDNGTNFVGANNKLRSFYKCLQEGEFQNEIVQRASNEGINWHFIPPNSPHFGGFWEAGVKSMKFHLRRIVGKLVLTFEELNTILTQIEACLNSRPISQLSSDPSDPQALTPGHFLIGTPLISIPDPDLVHLPVNRLNRWQLVQQCVQQLWRRWSTEYLSQLQQRSKWRSASSNIQPGMLVLVKEDNVSPLHWRLAVVEEVHRGPDNLVRVVSVRSPSGLYKRAITKLCPLPNNDDVE